MNIPAKPAAGAIEIHGDFIDGREVEAAIVWINGHHRLDPASPWGGVDDSGIGRECGTESFDDHFNVESVMVATDDQSFDWYRETATQRRLN